ncbi:ATP-binding protein [Pseudolabrys sp. FHR47]|uniref:ATP-binding protein n=1 Tax=Pseudolabrys sp. FHR47 TaxID=2562284 RepID=UPI0010BE46D6|nr:ATP-binding protein [Pseudolabrys sp. FHR47]
MDTIQPTGISSSSQPLGRVIAVTGAQASVDINGRPLGSETPTVGKFMALTTAKALIVALITDVREEPIAGASGNAAYRKIAHLDLIGEIKNVDGSQRFQRGVTEYPNIGDQAAMLGERELRFVYGGADGNHAYIGDLQQNPKIGVHIDIDSLVSRHFSILGTTGVGKSSGVAIILQKILETRPNLRIFLVDPHNEYGRCFGDKANVLNPRNLRLPFWLFNFEETVDAFFGGRPGVEEEVEILAEVIPLAKGAYLQLRNGGGNNGNGLLTKKKEARDFGFTADTPVPYRIEDLIGLLDERMGKLENRSRATVYHRLIGRIQTFRNHPRYAFMFENANIGGDTMAEILGSLFRLPPNGRPMTVMQLAGFPAEVVDSVVSVLCRMAFDFGLWSDGVAPLLFVCEEAHRYAPADKKIGFGPTKRALSRIAKEGRKYGVFLGLVTQRPAEIDTTIISQCSTLFVMRLASEGDQKLIRSAVSDAAASLLDFIPSLGTREVFAFGAGVALPTRMRFLELTADKRPNSEASGSTQSQAGTNMDRDLLTSVIDRWRSASMSQRISDDLYDDGSSFDAPPLQPSQPAAYQPAPPVAPTPPNLGSQYVQAPAPSYAPVTAAPYTAQPAAPAQRPDGLRSSLLKKPLDQLGSGSPSAGSPNKPILPSRFR